MNSQIRPMMLGLIIALFLSHNSFGKQADSVVPAEIVALSQSSTKLVHQRGNLFFASQFDLDDMQALREQKIA